MPLTISLFIGMAFVQLPAVGSSDTEMVVDTNCFEKRPFVTAPVITEVILPPATFIVAVPVHADVFALLHLMVAVTFNGPAFASDAHVPFLAETIVPFVVPLVMPGVPLHRFSGSLNAIVFAVGTLLSPGDTATLTCGIVHRMPLTAPTAAVPDAPIGTTSATTHAKAAHRSHACPPGLRRTLGQNNNAFSFGLPENPFRVQGNLVAGGFGPLRRILHDHADVAQLVEHNLAKVGVAGSSPVVRSRSLRRSAAVFGR